MKRQYRNYTDDDIRQYAGEVKSLSELLRKLNLTVASGNFINMRKNLQRLNINCDHWTGQAWNKDLQTKKWNDYNKIASIRIHLIKERGYKCEHCNLTEWNNQSIPLEIDHIDGNRTNNKKENLKILCCNCHAQTTTWRGRKNSKRNLL